MTYYADTKQRARLIAGLYDLAIFLETNPGRAGAPAHGHVGFPVRRHRCREAR